MSISLMSLVGPTACRKTDLAIWMHLRAKQKGFELPLINADSVQVYQDLVVGSARPSEQELKIAPHHLLAFVPSGERYTAGIFYRDFRQLIEQFVRQNIKSAVLVGGSGFYLQTLQWGLLPIPDIPEKIKIDFRKRATSPEGLANLYLELQKRDPERAAKISDKDTYRICRALEILTVQPLTLGELERQWKFAQASSTLQWRKIGLFRKRPSLRNKVRERTEKMLEKGLIDETKALIDRGFSDWPALHSVGYDEACQYLQGKVAQCDLVQLIETSTMQLAKRQLTWFRRDKEIGWFDVDDEWDAATRAAEAWLDLTSGLRTE